MAALQKFHGAGSCIEVSLATSYTVRMQPQTRRQREVLDAILSHLETNGYRPSYQKIARALGLKSRAGIARIVRDLEGQGILERIRSDGHFAIEMNRTDDAATIAWLDIGADQPAEPLMLPSNLLGGYPRETLRLFRVPDGSLAPEIDEGDISIIELRDFCRDGQAIVATINEKETVLRRYFKDRSDIELRSDSADAKTIVLPATRVKIHGVHRGLIRPVV